MAHLALEDHPNRFKLVNELHARPFPSLTPPCRAVYLAIKQPANAAERDREADVAHLRGLLEHYGAPQPAPGVDHYSGELGRGFLKWEMHTEFVTYTLFSGEIAATPFSGDMFNLFPRDWLVQAPGRVITSCLVRVQAVEPQEMERAIERDLNQWFVPGSLAVSRVVDGAATVAADFRLDENGHTRFAVLAKPDIGRRRLGRIVQRLLEVETYKTMAMLTLPLAREVATATARLDRALSDNVASMAEEQGHEPETLEELLKISAEIELMSSTSAFRFSAAEAYEAIVAQRVDALREERIGGRQLLGEFMVRRFDPAMRTCRSAKARLTELSGRAERAANLLRTRVDVANQQQNTEALRAMERRAALQLRLQQTVEGLSVVAISYYAVNLAAGLAAPLGDEIGWSRTAITAALTLPVIAAVWFMVRRIRRHIVPEDESA